MNTAILIPAYQPDQQLIQMVNELSSMHFPLIIVVNDGSSDKCKEIFSALDSISSCKVLHHPSNRGKGAALKTGFKEITSHHSELVGCITVDADGQHLSHDIRKIANSFERNSDTFILGSRDFRGHHIPIKSRFGNLMTRAIYMLSTGKSIIDTQTGLRAIPMHLMSSFLELQGDHYELEMNMLMYVAQNDIPINEIAIETVYLNDNSASHFNPLVDSIRIYKEILKFSLSSLACSAIDIGLFSLIYWIFSATDIVLPLLVATGFARLISSGVNFTMNKKLVFHSKEAVHTLALKYYILCGVQLISSWLLLEGFTSLGLQNVVLLKIVADSILFLISFGIQRMFIFGRKMPHEKNA